MLIKALGITLLAASVALAQAPLPSPTNGSSTSTSGNATQVNGASVPASKAIVGTNSSSQIVDASTTFIYPCNSASGSTTTYTCTTGYSITPTVGTLVLWRPDVPCSGNPTLSVDGATGRQVVGNGLTAAGLGYCGLFNTGDTQVLLAYDATNPRWIIVGNVSVDAATTCSNINSFLYLSSVSPLTIACNISYSRSSFAPTAITSVYNTTGNCSSAASPAVCSASSAGSVVVAAAGTTVTVNTTAVTANSQIFVFFDASLGTKLGPITCNSTVPALYGITARVAATSFTLTSSMPITNPACFSYFIVN